MEKKVPIKTIYLLLVISIGLISLAAGSTYAMFVASSEISNPISFVSNLLHDSDIIETSQISVPANGMVTTTLNITNSTNNVLNYTTWYINQGNDVEVVCENNKSQGIIANGDNVSVVVRVLNNSNETQTVNIGISSSDDSVVLANNMIQIDDINLLMSVTERPTDSTKLFLSSQLQRGQISSITFVDNINVPSGNTSVDVSKYTDSSIIMWYGTANESGQYDVFIGSDKGKTYVDSGQYLFLNMVNLNSIDFGNFFDNSLNNTMFAMFGICPKLTTMDVSGFDTSKVTNMRNLFLYDSSLISLNVSNWDTSNVTDMRYMFNCCTSLNDLDLSDWDVSNVTNMRLMFASTNDYGTMSLTTIGDVGSWDTGNVTNMVGMFSYCEKLEMLNVSDWDVSAVTDMNLLFDRCKSLKSLDVSNWDVSSVETMASMFQFCTSIKSLDLSKWNVSNVKDMGYMFLTTEDYGTMALTTIGNVGKWNTSNVTNMISMFQHCTNLEVLDASNWNTSNVENMNAMFYNCLKLTTIYASDNWVTTNVTDSNNMFYGCTSIVGGAGTTYNVSFVDKTYARIDKGTSTPGYFTSKV